MATVIIVGHDEDPITVENVEDRQVILVKVGNDHKPAMEGDLEPIGRAIVDGLKGDGTITILTHHAVSVEQFVIAADE